MNRSQFVKIVRTRLETDGVAFDLDQLARESNVPGDVAEQIARGVFANACRRATRMGLSEEREKHLRTMGRILRLSDDEREQILQSATAQLEQSPEKARAERIDQVIRSQMVEEAIDEPQRASEDAVFELLQVLDGPKLRAKFDEPALRKKAQRWFANVQTSPAQLILWDYWRFLLLLLPLTFVWWLLFPLDAVLVWVLLPLTTWIINIVWGSLVTRESDRSRVYPLYVRREFTRRARGGDSDTLLHLLDCDTPFGRIEVLQFGDASPGRYFAVFGREVEPARLKYVYSVGWHVELTTAELWALVPQVSTSNERNSRNLDDE